MKLELVKKYEPDDIDFHWSCSALNEEITASLVSRKDSNNYSLFFFGTEGMRHLTVDYLKPTSILDDNPVLFSKNGCFGIIKNQNELFFYHSIDSDPVKIEIENKRLFQQVLPSKTRLRFPNPISDSNVLPVCFQHDIFEGGSARYFTFLNLNIEKRTAKWASWHYLNEKDFPFHMRGGFERPPVIDNIMLLNDEVYIFTSGDSASVNKWGMGYYGIVKTTKKGEIIENLLDSGNLQMIDQKKRGVNGVFSSSQKYVILTPVFKNDEWKGKQKLFSLESKELIDIEFPRGFGKSPRIIQHSGKYFFVYLWDTRHFAICQEK